MPDTATGIEAPPTEHDPNSEAGFNALLAQQAGGELSEEAIAAIGERDTDVQRGLEITEESPRPRDEQGRFAPAAPPEAEEEAAPAAAEEREGEQPAAEEPAEPELSPLEKQLRDSQSFIGEQARMLGEERQKATELERRLAALEEQGQRQPQAPPAPLLPPEQLYETAEGLVDQYGPVQAALVALQQDPGERLYDAVVKTWAADDPIQAARFDSEYQTQKRQPATPAEPEAPQTDPLLAELRMERQVGDVIGEVRRELGDAEWAVVKDHIVPTLADEKTPTIIKNAVVSPDRGTQLEGVKALVALANGRAIAAATQQAREQSGQQAQERKQAAQVTNGSLRPVEERQPASGEELTTEQRTKLFHEALLSAETTSVNDGLTYAK